MSTPSSNQASDRDAPREQRRCWCGNDSLETFSPAYRTCSACGTLVLCEVPAGERARVNDEEGDFYGAHYHTAHMKEDYGYPSVLERARTDLPERCLHWLRAVLRHRRPPARVIEIGCGHGAFVAMLRWAGYDARGIELSHTIVDYARRVFDVPILQGPIEDQDIPAGSLDVIALMDVLEHFPDPLRSMGNCARLLAEDGLLVIQTPRFPEEKSYQDLVSSNDPFLQQMKPREHLYLFSERAIVAFLTRLGIVSVLFEPAIFAHYDMFLVAGREPLAIRRTPVLDLDETLPPEAHLVEALLTVDDQRLQLTAQIDDLRNRLAIADEQRRQRLELIQRQGDRIGGLEGERNLARMQLGELSAHLRAVEESRDEHGRSAAQHAATAAALQEEKTDLAARVAALTGRLAAAERLDVERRQAMQAQAARIAAQAQQEQALRERLAELQSSWAARLWRRSRAALIGPAHLAPSPVPQPAAPSPADLAVWMSAHAGDRSLFRLWEAHGFHVTPDHFYGPIPNLGRLAEAPWANDSHLPGIDMAEGRQLAFLEDMRSRFKEEYDAFPDRPTADPRQYYFDQPMFRSVDAEVLYSVIRDRQPRRVVEVGSGYSTLVTAAALRMNAASGRRGELVAIEPFPNEEILGGLAELTELRRAPVETVDLDLFQSLGERDVLFIDSSHVLRLDNDVRFLFLEVLPRLAAGVTVHVHDIFLPRDYPREWVIDEQRFWTEQYLLQAFLAFNSAFEVLWAGSYMRIHHSEALRRAFRSYDPGTVWPGSFWMRRADTDGR
jgi:SAM-dependent methyltransferase/predicted O-methyltransferase YrrM